VDDVPASPPFLPNVMPREEYSLFASLLYQMSIISVPLFLHFEQKKDEGDPLLKEITSIDTEEDTDMGSISSKKKKKKKESTNKSVRLQEDPVKDSTSALEIRKTTKKGYNYKGAFSARYMSSIQLDSQSLSDMEQKIINDILYTQIEPHFILLPSDKDEEPTIDAELERLRIEKENLELERERNKDTYFKEHGEKDSRLTRIQMESERKEEERKAVRDVAYQVYLKRIEEDKRLTERMKELLRAVYEARSRLAIIDGIEQPKIPDSEEEFNRLLDTTKILYLNNNRFNLTTV
jgi:hypothetical protein